MEERDAVLINEMLRVAFEYNLYRSRITTVEKLREADEFYKKKINDMIDVVEQFSEQESKSFYKNLEEVGSRAIREGKNPRNLFAIERRRECKRITDAVETIFQVKNQRQELEK